MKTVYLAPLAALTQVLLLVGAGATIIGVVLFLSGSAQYSPGALPFVGIFVTFLGVTALAVGLIVYAIRLAAEAIVSNAVTKAPARAAD